MLKTVELYDLTHTLALDFLSECQYPWQALSGIKNLILSLGSSLGREYVQVSPSVWVHKSARVAPTAVILPPAIICEGTEVRHCAFIRGSVLVGKNCVIGNSTELKNSILFDGVQVPHFNYIGDSILGFKAHLGAGAITSNVKSARGFVTVNCNGKKLFTGLKKCGAMLGDFAEIGCNAVLNPGTVIGRNSIVYPLVSTRIAVPENSILKTDGTIVLKSN